jgi:hypothetical protein
LAFCERGAENALFTAGNAEPFTGDAFGVNVYHCVFTA